MDWAVMQVRSQILGSGFVTHLRCNLSFPIVPEWSLALIGNASGWTLRVGNMLIRGVFDKETGGSRWRLRRTRCAMGFERQFWGPRNCGWPPRFASTSAELPSQIVIGNCRLEAKNAVWTEAPRQTGVMLLLEVSNSAIKYICPLAALFVMYEALLT